MRVVLIIRTSIRLDKSLTPVWGIWGTGRRAERDPLTLITRSVHIIKMKLLMVLCIPQNHSIKLDSNQKKLSRSTFSSHKITLWNSSPKTKTRPMMNRLSNTIHNLFLHNNIKKVPQRSSSSRPTNFQLCKSLTFNHKIKAKRKHWIQKSTCSLHQ